MLLQKNCSLSQISKDMNILFTNVGRRTYFIEFLRDLLNEEKKLNIHLSDCVKETSSFCIDDRFKFHITSPVNLDKEKYIDQILHLVDKNKINLVIPLSDFDVIPLSKNIDFFKELGATILLPSENIVEICMNKIKFEKFCLSNDLNTPLIYPNIFDKNLNFPLINKPIYGSGSNSINIINSKNSLIKLNQSKDFFLQEFIKGNEYGIDILNDFNGKYITSCVKKKISMRGGETDKAKVIINPKLTSLAYKISTSLRHVGNLDCDILEDYNGKFYCIDFNPRFGGGYPWTHLSGLNYIKLIIDLYNKKSISSLPIPNEITAMKGISFFKLKN